MKVRESGYNFVQICTISDITSKTQENIKFCQLAINLHILSINILELRHSGMKSVVVRAR